MEPPRRRGYPDPSAVRAVRYPLFHDRGLGHQQRHDPLGCSDLLSAGVAVDSLEQAEALLRPIMGSSAALVFALALLLAGLSSSVTAGMAGGSIFSGIFGRPYDIHDKRSRLGVFLSLAWRLPPLY